MIKRGKKKADANMIWIVIGLILALVIVAIVIIYLGKGTLNLGDWFKNIFYSENINNVKSGCEIACNSLGNINGWCKQERKINFKILTPEEGEKEGNMKSVIVTCESWSKNKKIENKQLVNIDDELMNLLTECPNIISCPT
ncbi:MAG: hypothetical protein QW117_01015 [Candidatus Pacearchaeota archaeon]